MSGTPEVFIRGACRDGRYQSMSVYLSLHSLEGSCAVSMGAEFAVGLLIGKGVC